MQGNLNLLPETARALYNNSTIRQLRERLSAKLSKLMKHGDSIEDIEIRQEVDRVRKLETKNTSRPTIGTTRPSVLEAGPSKPVRTQKRKAVAMALSSSSDEDILPPIVQKPKKTKMSKEKIIIIRIVEGKSESV
ncbi:uncharacterized protein LOC117321867 [Pecten maximus]|uniref:uncharacterized protein LOC117321867 n=1 Tax=Pecten maximus TaxID=6579 RepID=UPI00145876B9|nr:uncharacterized protein LOC117321867 [Pecten maximus]